MQMQWLYAPKEKKACWNDPVFLLYGVFQRNGDGRSDHHGSSVDNASVPEIMFSFHSEGIQSVNQNCGSKLGVVI
jgi:hypothetical protein